MILPRSSRTDSSRYAYLFIALTLVIMVVFLITGSNNLQKVESTRVQFDRLIGDWQLLRANLDSLSHSVRVPGVIDHSEQAFERFDQSLTRVFDLEIMSAGAKLSHQLSLAESTIIQDWSELRSVIASVFKTGDPNDPETLEASLLLTIRFENYLLAIREPLDEFVGDQERAQELLLWCLGGMVILIIAVFMIVEREADRLRRSAGISETVTRATIATQESERARISRSLHDSLAQELSLASLELALLAKRPEGLLQAEIDSLQALRTRLGRSVDWVRNLAHELRPLELDEMGLAEAVAAYCEDTSRTTQVIVKCRTEGIPIELSREDSINVYRIVQEAVGNAIRHARASSVHVLLAASESGTTLMIDDDGRGMRTNRREAENGIEGIGLITMKERASIIGGTLNLASVPGEGTSVSLEIPKRRDRRGGNQ